MADIDITPGSKSSASKTPGIKPSDTSDRTDPISGGGGDVSFEGDYTPKVTPKPGPDIDWTVTPDPDDGQSSGTPGDPIPTPVEPEYNPGVDYIRIEEIEFGITEFSEEELQKYIELGYTVVAENDDGSTIPVTWNDVRNVAPDPEEVLFDWSYADGLVDEVKDDIEAYKQTAQATYSTKTELDEATGAISREVAATYATKEENEASTHPNLSPFFAHDLNDYANFINNTIDAPWTNNDAYFLIKRSSGGFDVDIDNYSLDVTQLDDGWANVYMQNKKTTTQRFDFYIADPLDLKEDSEYTFLIEIRNNNSTLNAAGNNFYIVQNGENYGQNCWFWGAGITALLEGTNALGGVNLYTECPPGTTGVYRKRFVKKTEKTGSTRWKGTHIRTLVSLVFLLKSQEVLNFDIRVSMYEGRYLGIYKPYVVPDSKLATKSLVSQTAEAINASVTTRFTDVQTQIDGIDSSMEAMQGQLDGLTNVWYGTNIPSATNYPANQWTTEELKSQHNGDLYFNQDNGNAWRWLKDGSTWKWVAIPAGEAQEALNKAQQALDELVEVKRDYVTKAEQTITDDEIRQSVSDSLDTAKTYASGLVTTEQVNRDAAISTMANSIKMEVAEEYATKNENSTSTHPNLGKYFLNPFSDYYNSTTNPDAYWRTLHVPKGNGVMSNTEGLHAIYDDPDLDPAEWPKELIGCGWAHLTLDSRSSAGNTGKTSYFNLYLNWGKLKIKESTTYTWVVEVANSTITGGQLSILPSIGNATLDKLSNCDTGGRFRFAGDGIQRGTVTSKDDFSFLHGTQDTRGYARLPQDCYADAWIRISLFEGEYTGDYKPYVDDPRDYDKKYSTKAELNIQADRITSSVEASRTMLEGGMNLLVGTEKPQWTGKKTNAKDSIPNATNPTYWDAYAARTNTVSRTDTSIKLEQGTTSGTSGFVIPLQYDGAVVKLGTYTIRCRYRTNMPNTGALYLLMRANPNYSIGASPALVNDGEWHDFSFTFTNNYTGTSVPYALLFGYRNTANEYLEIQDQSMSMVRGDQATSSRVNELSTTVTQTATDVQTAITQSSNAVQTANAAIKSVAVQYAQNQSATTAPTTGWSTTAPAWKDGYYIWSRTATTTSNGTTYSAATNITGAKGSDGTDGDPGRGVSSIVEQYYISTSSTTQTGGSWGTDQPVWSANKYIWTRSIITWSDGTSTNTDPVLAKAINGANETAKGASDLATSISTVIRQYGQGVLVSKTSETIGALLNANASFDIVPVSWSGTTPTADTTTNNKLATFGASSFTIGKPTGKNLSGTANGIYLKDGGSNLAFVTPTTAQLGKDDQKNVQLTTGGLYLRDASTNLAAFTPTSVTLGKSDNYNVNLSAGTTGAGLYLRNGATNLAQFTTTAITLGTLGTSTDPKKNIVINENGIYLRYYSNAYASFTTDSITLGLTSSGQSNVVLTSNGAQLRSGTTVLAKYASDEITIGSTSGRHILIDSTTLKLKDGTAELSSWKSSEIRIGKTGTSNRNVLIDSNGLSIRDNTTVLSSFKSGEVIIGQVAASQRNVLINSSGLSIRENTTVLASFKSGEVIIGQVAASKRNVIINSSGLTIRENTTSLASFTATQISLGSESPFTITRKLFTIKTPSSSGTGSGSVSTTRYITNLSVPESENKNALAFSAGTTEIRLDSDGIYETNRITGARAFITPTVPDDVDPDVTNTKTWSLSMETTSSNVFSLTNGTTVNIKKPGTYIIRFWWWDNVSNGGIASFDIKFRSSSTVYRHHYGTVAPLYAGAHLIKSTVSVKDGDTLQFYIQTVTKGLNFSMADMDIIRCTDYK